MTALEEEIDQLKADNKELMSRVAAIEEIVADNNGGGGGGGKKSTSTSAWYDNNGIIANMIKPIMLLAAITGFIFA